MRPVEASRRISDKPCAFALTERESKRLRYAIAASVEPGLDVAREVPRWLDEAGNPGLNVALDAAGKDLGRFDLAGVHSAANVNALSRCQEPRQPE